MSKSSATLSSTFSPDNLAVLFGEESSCFLLLPLLMSSGKHLLNTTLALSGEFCEKESTKKRFLLATGDSQFLVGDTTWVNESVESFKGAFFKGDKLKGFALVVDLHFTDDPLPDELSDLSCTELLECNRGSSRFPPSSSSFLILDCFPTQYSGVVENNFLLRDEVGSRESKSCWSDFERAVKADGVWLCSRGEAGCFQRVDEAIEECFGDGELISRMSLYCKVFFLAGLSHEDVAGE